MSAINEYAEGGLKIVIDLEGMVKSLRLAWLKRILYNSDGIWKRYLQRPFQHFGVFFTKTASIPELFTHIILYLT